MADRPGGGSRGRLTFQWNPADHATWCPQHNPPPADGGGSSWLCCCSGPLYELRAAARAVIDSEYGSNMWVEAFDVLVDVVAEQERLEALAEREGRSDSDRVSESATDREAVAASRSASVWNPDDLRDPDASCEEADLPADERARIAAEDRAATVRLYGEEHVARLEAETNRG